MTIFDHIFADLYRALDEIVGRHPELASTYESGWTRALQDHEPAEAFNAKPKKRRKK